MNRPTEAAEQVALMRWRRLAQHQLPGLDLLLAVPNGGSRDYREAGHLKAQGVSPGFPDLLLPVARRGYHGLCIELKREGGRVREHQTEWIRRLLAEGYHAEVCYGFDAARRLLEWYLSAPRSPQDAGSTSTSAPAPGPSGNPCCEYVRGGRNKRARDAPTGRKGGGAG